MPLKLAFNPITANLDLVQDVSEYAKLAISTTVAELETHIANSTLIPNQWYLITDYQTFDYIRNSNTTDGNEGTYEFHTGEIEQILVKASSENELFIDGLSYTYPDEKIKYQQSRDNYNKSQYGEYDTGSSYGEFDIVIEDATTMSFDNSYKPLSEMIVNNFDCYIEDYITGGSLYLDSSNYNDVWEIDGEEIVLLKPYQENYNYYYPEWSGEESTGDLEITINSANSFTLDEGVTLDWSYVDMYIYDETNDVEVEITDDNYGTVWTRVGNTITIVDYAGDLTDELMSMSGEFMYVESTVAIDLTNDCYIHIDCAWVAQELGGIITSRENLVSKLYVECDYRATKFRRYKADVAAYNAGTTYNEGDIVSSGGSIYIAVRSGGFSGRTPATSGSSAYYWSILFPSKATTNFFSTQLTIGWLSSSSPSYGNYYLTLDYTTYTDYDMFPNGIDTLIYSYKTISNSKIVKGFIPASNMEGLNVIFFGKSYFQNAEVIQNTASSSACLTNVRDSKVVYKDFVSTTNSSRNKGIINSTINLASYFSVDSVENSYFENVSVFYAYSATYWSAVGAVVSRFIGGGLTAFPNTNNVVTGTLSNIHVAGLPFDNNTVSYAEQVYSATGGIRTNTFTYVYNLYSFSSISNNKVFGLLHNVSCSMVFSTNIIFGSLGNGTTTYGVDCVIFRGNIIYGTFYGLSSQRNYFYEVENNQFFGQISNNNAPYTSIKRTTFYSGLTSLRESASASASNLNNIINSTFYGGVENGQMGYKGYINNCSFFGTVFRLEFGDAVTTGFKLLKDCSFNGNLFIMQVEQGTIENNKFSSVASFDFDPATEAGVFEDNVVGTNFGGSQTDDVVTGNTIGNNCNLTLSNEVTDCIIVNGKTGVVPALDGVTWDSVEYTGDVTADGYFADTEEGQTTTATVVTDVRDNAGQMQKKTQLLTFTSGLLTAQGAESDWTDTTDI